MLLALLLLVAVVAFIALWRNGWDFRKAWEAAVVFVGALAATAVDFWD